MMRANVDILAVSLLLAGAALFSAARKVEVWDVFSQRGVVFEHAGNGPTVKLVSLLPLFSCMQD